MKVSNFKEVINNFVSYNTEGIGDNYAYCDNCMFYDKKLYSYSTIIAYKGKEKKNYTEVIHGIVITDIKYSNITSKQVNYLKERLGL